VKINSFNEWDKVLEVIVGVPDTTAYVTLPSGNPPTGETLEILTDLAQQAFPKVLLDEVEEDFDNFCKAITAFGAKVIRPTSKYVREWFSHAGWSSTGTNLYNVRDLHLVVGNTVIESPSQMKHRYFEAQGLRDIWYEYFKEGFRWVCAPKPRLEGDYMIPFYENGNKYHKLAETEILFEAANTVRMGRDLLFLVSASGNYLGAKWLQSVLGDQYRVHTTEGIYRSAHIDSTVICLRPGLVLLNGERVSPDNCPPIYDKWEKIYFNDIISYPTEVLDFHRDVSMKIHEKLNSYHVQNDLNTMTSIWTGMNLFSLDQETVIVDERQTGLIKTLEKHRFTCIPLKMNNQYLMKGAFHCSTLDTVREGTLESYFD